MVTKDLIFGALKYATVATTGFVLANVFFVDGEVEVIDLAIAASIGLPMCFGFFFAVFYVASRMKGTD